jgi:putative transposase
MPERKSTPVEAGDATAVVRGVIEDIAREGARQVLQLALEAEVEEHLRRFQDLRDGGGGRAVVRNGHAPPRTILTGVGDVTIQRPRVDEREAEGMEGHERFTSGILPRFLRRTPTLEGGDTLDLGGWRNEKGHTLRVA